jgi:hypothetical protein
MEPFNFRPGYKPKNVGKIISQDRKNSLEKILDKYYEHIKERNLLDIELYNSTKNTILPNEKKNYGKQFDQHLQEFKEQNIAFSNNMLRYLDFLCRKWYYNLRFTILHKINNLGRN